MFNESKLTIKCNKTTLVNKLEENRAKHTKLVDEAKIGYVEKALEALKKKQALLEEGKVVALTFNISPPMDKTGEYDTVLRMLELHQGQEIDLTFDDYQHFIEDKWEWREHWIAHNAIYSAGTRALQAG